MSAETQPGPVSLNYVRIDRDLVRTLQPARGLYYGVLAALLAVAGWGAYAWSVQLRRGLGIAGINWPVGWACYITLFVYWVGIAHSGTLISAVLFLFRVRWRAPIYRTAEAVTVFAVLTAGLFPLIHLGRTWVAYWLMPYPQMGGLLPNFRSPLIWDVFAVSTYLAVSAIFFFTGMVPDLAIVRDRSIGWRQKFYGFLAQGWQGTNRQWHHYAAAYVFLAGLATPLVISVHSIVSWDFAMSVLPGWHTAIFPPYFVAGAIHSGLAMVMLIVIPMRRIFRLHAFLTAEHLASMAKMMILTGLLLGYAYCVEFFMAWYSDNPYERDLFFYRAFGDYAWALWLLVACNVLAPALFFFRRVRYGVPWLVAISLFVNIGMFYERFVIIVTSLGRSYDPYSWGLYAPRWPEISILFGSVAWFFLLFLLFAKMFPVVSMWEIKEQMPLPKKEAAQA
ncbi:MAG: NrfD/PsrC family molybdoenzyme membrane anchor subunit [Bryobacteraceae bacterium]|jgi:molybdopterin-containing oxidoreductase family membrane subunit